MISQIENLPEISFIDNTSAEEILNKLISDYEEKLSELSGKEIHLSDANEDRLLLGSVALVIAQAYQYIDRAGKQNLLKYSYAEFLDNIAALKGISRIEAQPATLVCRFSLSETRASNTSIPLGTRISASNDVYFATTEYAEIAAGSLYVDVPMKCTVAGSSGNGYAIGTLTTLVDPIAYVRAVSNTTVSFGGTDIEDDDSLRERIYLAPSAYSVAGPEAAYIYWAKTFSNEITDVKVSVDPEEHPGVVYVCFLLSGGVIPNTTMIEGLADYLSDNNIRPLTDLVVVQAPTVSTYDITFTYYINKSDSAQAMSIQNAVAEAVEKYKSWQNAELGRDINPSKLIEMVMSAGAKRVVLTSPTHTAISDTTVAVVETTTVTYGGTEDD